MFNADEIKRLLDIACAGSHKGFGADARTIFEVILAQNPHHSGAKLGLAHNYITVNDFENAETLLKEIIAVHAEDFDAKALLGLCYALSNRMADAKPLLEEVINSSCASKELAEALLEAK
jgi:thioredoxin-like negative regulator of GroEL